MTTPNPLYFPIYTLSEGSILNKDTGSPLASGIVRFYRDTSRNTFKEVYQLTGTSPNYTFVSLGYTLTLSDIGTFVDDQGDPVVPYLYPYDADGNTDLYYATCYSSLDGVTPAVFQFDVEAIPHLDDSGTENAGNNFENELSNPQFVDVLFYPTHTDYTYTLSGSATVPIAPNWDIVVSGAGTLTVKRVAITPGNVPTDPPYALEINSTGFGGSDIRLRQRLLGNSYIFTNGALNGYFIANSQDGASHTLTMTFNQSSGTPSGSTIATGSATSGGAWVQINGSVTLPVSTSSDTAPNGYVDIDVLIPIGAHIQITSLQLVSTETALSPENNVYDQQTIYRQQDHLAHYYKPQLAYKPIPSYTIGWDFRYNPCQQLGRTVAAVALGANKSRYIADQTIAFEAVSNVLSYTIQSSSGLAITTTGTPSQCAIIQYLDKSTARKILESRTCVQLKSYVSLGTLSGTINIYWTTDVSLPVITSITGQGDSLVSGMTAGAPTVGNGSWTKLSRGNFNDAAFTLTTTPLEYQFNAWESDANGATIATYIAIVIGFNTIPTGTFVTINHCSLQSGDIPTSPAPLSTSQTLAALQAYYETSWIIETNPETLTQAGSLSLPMDWNTVGLNINAYSNAFTIPYSVTKRAAVTPTTYPTLTAATAGSVSALLYRDAALTTANVTVAGNWSTASSDKYVFYQPTGTNVLVSGAAAGVSKVASYLSFQYIADARFGVV